MICPKDQFQSSNAKSFSNHMRKHKGMTNKGKSYNEKENNGQWKGEKVSYGALHDFIKYHLKKPKRCTKCNKPKTFMDIANISGQYKRDLTDWEWLCRSCHMKIDGRLENLHNSRKVVI